MAVITSSCRQLEALTFQKSFSKDLMKIQLKNGILWQSSLTPVDLPGSLCILSSAPLTALACLWCLWCLYPRGGAGRHCPRHATTLLLSPRRRRAVTAARRAVMAPLWSCAEQGLLSAARRCVALRLAAPRNWNDKLYARNRCALHFPGTHGAMPRRTFFSSSSAVRRKHARNDRSSAAN